MTLASLFPSLSILVQGPDLGHITLQCLNSVAQKFPSASLVFSTWKSLSTVTFSQASKLGFNIVFSDDPGPEEFSRLLDKSSRLAWSGVNCNCNRHKISTISGLSAISSQYTLKLRSDTLVKSVRSLLIYHRHKDLATTRFPILKQRILVPHAHSPQSHPFYISDFYQFGLTQDLLSLWSSQPLKNSNPSDIARMTTEEFERIYLISPESYLWSSFVHSSTPIRYSHRYDISSYNTFVCEDLIYNALILLERDYSGFHSLKYPSSLYISPHPQTIFFGDWLIRQSNGS
jgi:hypothetical protein